jgi:hypothetical protein
LQGAGVVLDGSAPRAPNCCVIAYDDPHVTRITRSIEAPSELAPHRIESAITPHFSIRSERRFQLLFSTLSDELSDAKPPKAAPASHACRSRAEQFFCSDDVGPAREMPSFSFAFGHCFVVAACSCRFALGLLALAQLVVVRFGGQMGFAACPAANVAVRLRGSDWDTGHGRQLSTVSSSCSRPAPAMLWGGTGTGTGTEPKGRRGRPHRHARTAFGAAWAWRLSALAALASAFVWLVRFVR